MATVKKQSMIDNEVSATILLTIYSIGISFLNIAPPPPYMDAWIQPVLHATQFAAAILAIILGCHAVYEKFYKKK